MRIQNPMKWLSQWACHVRCTFGTLIAITLKALILLQTSLCNSWLLALQSF
uniref:Uncharacterized protein n=1 Tax=Anguilla anguilla TaxID=7936 RepID=A0A0E9VEU8_ANGAN